MRFFAGIALLLVSVSNRAARPGSPWQTPVPWSDDFEPSTNPGYLPGVDPTGGRPPFVSLGGWETRRHLAP